ncbi:hypothetical protein [Melissospora conviva]|uniref:hypothetical protein n=1 Tax=Melissospora conviva TaxID=3388432 RepID=UPI003B7B4961
MRNAVRMTVLGTLLLSLLWSPTAAGADGLQAQVSKPSASAGDVVEVTGSGWPRNALIQLTTCGELAVTGSSACDMPSALATGIRDDGTFAVDLRMGTPPRPCPCVIHVAVVGTTTVGNKTPAQVDIPIEMPDQPTAPVPQVGTAPARLEVLDARLTGGNSVAAWFGGSVTRKLVYTVKNPGPEALQNPPLQVTLGRSGDDGGLPTPATTSLGAGQTQTYEVPVEFPFAAFGRYDVKASLAGMGNATVTHHAYPWGLVLINILGVALVIGGIVYRLRLNRPVQTAVPTAAGGQLLLPSVVRLPSLGAHLVFDDAPGNWRLRRLSAGRISNAALLELLGLHGQAVPGATGATAVDVAEPPGSGGDEGSRAVIDLDALDGFLANRGALSWATPTQLFKVPKLRSANGVAPVDPAGGKQEQ